MPSPLHRTRNRIVLGACAIIPLSLALLTLLWFRAADDHLVGALAEVQRTRDDIAAVDRVLRLTADVQTAASSYRQTGQAEFLEPTEGALAELSPLMTSIERRMRDGRADRLNRSFLAAVRAANSYERNVIREARRSDSASPDRAAEVREAHRLADNARKAAADLLAMRESNLVERRAAGKRAIAHARHANIALVVALFVLCAFVGFLIWQVSRARTLAVMCAWSRTVQYEGEWLSFEDYLHKRFGVRVSHGISPSECEKMIANVNACPPPGATSVDYAAASMRPPSIAGRV